MTASPIREGCRSPGRGRSDTRHNHYYHRQHGSDSTQANRHFPHLFVLRDQRIYFNSRWPVSRPWKKTIRTALYFTSMRSSSGAHIFFSGELAALSDEVQKLYSRRTRAYVAYVQAFRALPGTPGAAVVILGARTSAGFWSLRRRCLASSSGRRTCCASTGNYRHPGLAMTSFSALPCWSMCPGGFAKGPCGVARPACRARPSDHFDHSKNVLSHPLDLALRRLQPRRAELRVAQAQDSRISLSPSIRCAAHGSISATMSWMQQRDTPAYLV